MCAESGSTSVQRSRVPGVQKMRPAKPLRDQPRQVAAVIEMRVRQHHRVDRRGRIGSARPVAQPQLLQPLKQPAIDQDPTAAQIEQMLGAGDRAGGSEKRQSTASDDYTETRVMSAGSIQLSCISMQAACRRCRVWRCRAAGRRRAELRYAQQRLLTHRRHLRPVDARQFQRQPDAGDHLDRRHPLPWSRERARRRRLDGSRRGERHRRRRCSTPAEWKRRCRSSRASRRRRAARSRVRAR